MQQVEVPSYLKQGRGERVTWSGDVWLLAFVPAVGGALDVPDEDPEIIERTPCLHAQEV